MKAVTAVEMRLRPTVVSVGFISQNNRGKSSLGEVLQRGSGVKRIYVMDLYSLWIYLRGSRKSEIECRRRLWYS